jgi:hypothetical protein
MSNLQHAQVSLNKGHDCLQDQSMNVNCHSMDDHQKKVSKSRFHSRSFINYKHLLLLTPNIP